MCFVVSLPLFLLCLLIGREVHRGTDHYWCLVVPSVRLCLLSNWKEKYLLFPPRKHTTLHYSAIFTCTSVCNNKVFFVLFLNCFCIIYTEGALKAVLHFTARILKVYVQQSQLNKVCVCQIPARVSFYTRISPHNSASLDILLEYCIVQNTMWQTVPCRQIVRLQEIDCTEEQIMHESKVVTENDSVIVCKMERLLLHGDLSLWQYWGIYRKVHVVKHKD